MVLYLVQFSSYQQGYEWGEGYVELKCSLAAINTDMNGKVSSTAINTYRWGERSIVLDLLYLA